MIAGMSDERMENEALLPFYVNGTLREEERKRVEDALREDGALRSEAEALRRVRATLREEEEGYSPGEFGLARLMREIDRDDRRSRPALMQGRLLAASVVAAAVAVGATLFIMRGGDTYRQASEDTRTERFTVAFRPDAPESSISGLLREYGLEIVDGPSAIGLYRLDPGRNADLAALLADLRTRADVIETIQLE